MTRRGADALTTATTALYDNESTFFGYDDAGVSYGFQSGYHQSFLVQRPAAVPR